jgi:hypothetical protein
MVRLASVLLLVTTFALVSGCKKPNEDPNGVGPWMFGRSKLADAEAAGRCLPLEGGEMHCIGLTVMTVGGQAAETQVYFKSKDKDAALIEISLGIRACDAKAVAADLTQRIGPPKSQSADGALLTWSLSTMFVRALVPDKQTGECQINFVDPKDEARINDLKAGK